MRELSFFSKDDPHVICLSNYPGGYNVTQVLLDPTSIDMDGFDVLQKATEKQQSLPIVILTTVADQPHVYHPKAFYSGAPQGKVVCHRCRELLDVSDISGHTAVCWPEYGHSL